MDNHISRMEKQLLTVYSQGKYMDMGQKELEELQEKSGKYLVNKSGGSLSNEETLQIIELHVIISLILGYDDEAGIALQNLIDRFGLKTPRISALKSLQIEATEGPIKAIEWLRGREIANSNGNRNENLNRENNKETDDVNVSQAILKRQVAILKQSDVKVYVEGLNKYLEIYPSDSEGWVELGEVFYKENLYSQAIFCLQEVILLIPLAYNIYARIGEIYYQFALYNTENIEDKLINSIKHFSRSIELCENYVRAWCGVYLSTNKLLSLSSKNITSLKLYIRLNDLSKRVLGGTEFRDLEVVRAVLGK